MTKYEIEIEQADEFSSIYKEMKYYEAEIKKAKGRIHQAELDLIREKNYLNSSIDKFNQSKDELIKFEK